MNSFLNYSLVNTYPNVVDVSSSSYSFSWLVKSMTKHLEKTKMALIIIEQRTRCSVMTVRLIRFQVK